VYSNKKDLKNHPDKIFITENLTKYRTELVKQLAELKYNGLLYTYWTSDGRIFLKQNTTRFLVVYILAVSCETTGMNYIKVC
jgi:hypothetical protein